ncbi:hypothetical protein B0G62_101340 [Paraburkholderia eburnea]|uniref:O-antigen ligase-like membrane protein n=1 Tax=Paraburkholderia eburnea TaxID=1189126 RepID=A0A2S4MME3_9BURK|nr:hypothetical protein [Paraburkholderia eburnea]POR55944.1 hypothetical protein B0G62_101340 [Paraburkholderia eburnea]PRZ27071.1 hypothetical protein BX588_101339 [Paraburkholderia eburnea]
MGLTGFGVIVFVCGLLALNASYRWSVYGLASLAMFACASALVLPGNISILPANLFLAFFAIRAFNLGGGAQFGRVVEFGKPGFWLLCTVLWAVFGAIVLPRALAGSTLVFTIDRNAVDPNQAGMLQPLGPVSGNLTQSVYCVGDLIAYCCMGVFMNCRGAYRVLANGILLVAGLNVAAGVIDIASHAAGVDVLSVVKTAQFADLSGWTLGGLVRISGTFSETAAFAYFTIEMFAFCLVLWLFGYRPKTSGTLAAGSALLLLLSTSGSAYVGLGGYLAVLVLSRPGQITRIAEARKLRVLILMVSLGVLAALYIGLFMPSVVKALSDFVEITVLSKADSASGVERAGLNAQAMTNFFETYGIGVGIGSQRVSSFAVVVLGGLGVVGTVCYALFIGKTAFAPIQRHYPLEERAIAYAARHGVFAALIVASVSGSTFYLGPCFYMLAAAAGGLSVPLRRRAVAPPPRVLAVRDVPPEVVTRDAQATRLPLRAASARHRSLVSGRGA